MNDDAYYQFTPARYLLQYSINTEAKSEPLGPPSAKKRLSCLLDCLEHQVNGLGLAFLFASSTVTGFTALAAGYSRFITGPLMCRTLCVGGTSSLSGNLSLLFWVHRRKPSKPSGHTDTSLHPWTNNCRANHLLVFTPAYTPLN